MRNQLSVVAGAFGVCGLLCAQVARADLSIQGAVGLPINPTAQLPEKSSPRVQFNYTDVGVIGAGDSVKLYGVYGAARLGEKAEISGGYEKLNSPFDSVDRSGTALGFKYLLKKGDDQAPLDIAIGASYSLAQGNNGFVYAVGSKSFGETKGERAAIMAHLGVRYDLYDYGYFEGPDSKKFSVYSGVEVPLTRRGQFSFIGEYASKNNTFANSASPYSASLRFRPRAGGFSATVGLMRRGVSTPDSGLFAQVGTSF